MIKVTTILKCNSCPNVASKQVANIAMIEFARMVANEKGWVTINKNGLEVHICPTCQQANKSIKDEPKPNLVKDELEPNLDQIEVRAAAAIPLINNRDPMVTNGGGIVLLYGPYPIAKAEIIADFYRHTRLDIPFLLAKIRQLEAKLEANKT